MTDHDFVDLHRDVFGLWVVRCSCGWSTGGEHQSKSVMTRFDEHVAEMSETNQKEKAND